MTNETAAKESLLRRQLQEQAEARAKMTELTREQIEERRDAAQSIIDASPEGPNIVLDGLRETVAICDLALAALRAPNPGWVSVPREPTWEIRKAIWTALFDEEGWHGGTAEVAQADTIYRAVIAAAVHSPQTNPAAPRSGA